MRTPNVVVIDSVIDKNHTYLKDTKIKSFIIDDSGNIIEYKSSDKASGHGTAICGIISKNAVNSNITAFGIFDSKLRTPIDRLVKTLEFIRDNIECDIINMSLGTSYDDRKLKDICLQLASKGIILISAFDNAGGVSFPAAYSCVIGVDASLRCMKAEDFVYVENSIVNLKAKGGSQRVAWVNPSFTINQGASFAAAYVTAYVAKMLYFGTSKEEILQQFKKYAKYIYDYKIIQNISFEIPKSKKIAIIPFNKETQSLINFDNQLKYSIQNIYDVKYSGNVGLTVKGMNSDATYNIKNIDKCDYNDIDIFIIGHLEELEAYSKNKVKEKVLLKCLDNGVNVYSFDNYNISEFKEKFKEKKLKLYSPEVLNEQACFNKFGKLYKIKSPVLGIFGTTRHQGKFTLQIQLRKALKNLGYSVCQLGSEPSSILFGMDSVYAFGYRGCSQLDDIQSIEYLNFLMHEMDIKDPDIILVGSQSGTVPMLYNNMGQMTNPQISFLLGTNPDGVILCANMNDSINYIIRTIKAIEGISNSKVISIGIYPMIFENGWGIISNRRKKASVDSINTFKNSIKTRLNLDSFVINDSDEENILIKNCIDYFRKTRR